MMQPMFHRRVLTEFNHLIDDCTERFIHKWEAQAARGELVNVTEDMSELTLDIVLRSIFGPDFDRLSQQAGGNPFDVVTKEQARDLKFAYKFRQLGKLIMDDVERRRREGARTGDIVSHLIDARDRQSGEPMSDRELLDEIMTLIIAGHETTANNISLGVVTLLQQKQWIDDERMIEELLRYHSVADLVALRVAIEDVEIGGQLVRAGEGIVPLVAGANHDPEMFERPHEFDPSRSATGHVAFGYGVHQCLGQNLVRAELQILLDRLFSRVPDLRLAVDPGALPFKYFGQFFGPSELPVTW